MARRSSAETPAGAPHRGQLDRPSGTRVPHIEQYIVLLALAPERRRAAERP
jgi:hypothetical protein